MFCYVRTLLYTTIMIITISGTPGSGKSTVGKKIAKKLGYTYYSIGGMRRAMAQERGMTLQEFNVLGETESFTDRDIDAWQKKLGSSKDNMVVEGRTSFFFIPHSVKIFLKANLREAARRIFHDPAHVRRFEASHHYTTVKELEHGLRGRMASDARRYKKYYRLNIYLPKHYDLILNTTKLSPTKTLQKILLKLANPVRGKNSKMGSKNAGQKPGGTRQTSNGAKISQNNKKGDRFGISNPLLPKNNTKKILAKKTKIRAKVKENRQ